MNQTRLGLIISTLEASAMAADAEADRLDTFANELRSFVKKGEDSPLHEYEAGARAARRIAMAIREMKVSEEEG